MIKVQINMRERETGQMLLTSDDYITVYGDVRNARDIFLAQCEDALHSYKTEEEMHPLIECMSILAMKLPVSHDDIECVVNTVSEDELSVDYSITTKFLDELHDVAFYEYAKNMAERFVRKYCID